MRSLPIIVFVLIATTTTSVAAQSTGEPESPPFTLRGYAEASYAFNFNRPANNVNAFRGFDSRHNTFNLENAVIDAAWDSANVVGRVALQVGTSGATYYLAEPAHDAVGGIAATDSTLFRYVQQANIGYRFPVMSGLLVQGGLFLSPIGPESVVVHDNWNWSRSNLFFGLPFYHLGARAALSLNDRWTLTLGVYNGWNNIVDNNAHKSIQAQVNGALTSSIAWSFLYMVGIERDNSSARHLFDSYLQWTVNDRLSLMLHADAGFEPNDAGTSAWGAAALYARMKLVEGLFVAARADYFREHAASDGTNVAPTIFFPTSWVTSGTLTLEAKPADQVSFRLEFRHDHAADAIYFGRSDAALGTERSQNTLSLGATAWF